MTSPLTDPDSDGVTGPVTPEPYDPDAPDNNVVIDSDSELPSSPNVGR